MTALQLLGIICTALLLQVAVGVGVTLWRRGNLASQVPQHDAHTLPAESKGAWQGWRDFRVTRRTFEDAAKSQCSIYLQPVDGAPLPAFKPGQYLTVSLPLGSLSEKGLLADAGAERRLIRCYSLSDSPDPATYRVTIKRALAPPDRRDLPPGVASGYLHDHVQVDDVLMLKAPSGRFFIDTETETPVVLVAGGIGITPMLSMLRWCTAMQPQRVVHLYYGVRNSADHAFKSMLESLVASCANFKLHVVYSNPDRADMQGRDYQHAGYVDLDLLRGTLTHGRHQFFMCAAHRR